MDWDVLVGRFGPCTSPVPYRIGITGQIKVRTLTLLVDFNDSVPCNVAAAVARISQEHETATMNLVEDKNLLSPSSFDAGKLQLSFRQFSSLIVQT